MTRTSLIRAGLAVVAALFLPSLLIAQMPPRDPAAASRQQEMDSIFMAFQQVHGQLQGIQSQALEDSVVDAAQIQLGEDVRAEMERQDPAVLQKLDRLNALGLEAQAVQQTGDGTRFDQLAEEAAEIERSLSDLQRRVVESPEIAAKIAAFQTQLEAKMVELDPRARDLLTRFRELETRLNQAMNGGA